MATSSLYRMHRHVDDIEKEKRNEAFASSRNDRLKWDGNKEWNF